MWKVTMNLYWYKLFSHFLIPLELVVQQLYKITNFSLSLSLSLSLSIYIYIYCGGQLIPQVQFALERAEPMAQYPVQG